MRLEQVPPALSHLRHALELSKTMTPEDWGPVKPHGFDDIPVRALFEVDLALAGAELNKSGFNPDELRDALGRWVAGVVDGIVPSAAAAELNPAHASAPNPNQSKNKNNQGKNSTKQKPYPNHWDAKVDKYVAAYNEKKGFKPGDKEYLDPNLVKAMIKQESQYDLKAYNNDPMQVNKFTRDWDDKKAKYGLKRGVVPGADLSIRAGIDWLIYKAYWYDDAGKPYKFKGWAKAVHDYNGGGNPNYVNDVYDLCPTCPR
jgi:hypothetical protein